MSMKPVWLPSCLPLLDQAIPRSLLKQSCSFHSTSHPRPVSSHTIQTLNCIQDNTYPSTSPASVNQCQLWELTGTMLRGVPGKAFCSSSCSTGRLLCISFWPSLKQEREIPTAAGFTGTCWWRSSTKIQEHIVLWGEHFNVFLDPSLGSPQPLLLFSVPVPDSSLWSPFAPNSTHPGKPVMVLNPSSALICATS